MFTGNIYYRGDKTAAEQVLHEATQLANLAEAKREYLGTPNYREQVVLSSGATLDIVLGEHATFITIVGEGVSVSVEEVEELEPEGLREAIFLWTPKSGYPQVMVYGSSKLGFKLAQVPFKAGAYSAQFHEEYFISFGNAWSHYYSCYAENSDQYEFFCGGYTLLKSNQDFDALGACVVDNKIFCFVLRKNTTVYFYSHPLVSIDYLSTDYSTSIIDVADLVLVKTVTSPIGSKRVSFITFSDDGKAGRYNTYQYKQAAEYANVDVTLSEVNGVLTVSVNTIPAGSTLTARSSYTPSGSVTPGTPGTPTGLFVYGITEDTQEDPTAHSWAADELDKKMELSSVLGRDGALKIAYQTNVSEADHYYTEYLAARFGAGAYNDTNPNNWPLNCGTSPTASDVAAIILANPNVFISRLAARYPSVSLPDYWYKDLVERAAIDLEFEAGTFSDEQNLFVDQESYDTVAQTAYAALVDISCTISGGGAGTQTDADVATRRDLSYVNGITGELTKSNDKIVPLNFSIRHGVCLVSNYKKYSPTSPLQIFDDVAPPGAYPQDIASYNPDYPVENIVQKGTFYYSVVTKTVTKDVIGLASYRGDYPEDTKDYADDATRLIPIPPSDVDGTVLDTPPPVLYGSTMQVVFLDHIKEYVMFSLSDKDADDGKTTPTGNFNTCCILYDVATDQQVDLVDMYNTFLIDNKLLFSPLDKANEASARFIETAGLLHKIPAGYP